MFGPISSPALRTPSRAFLKLVCRSLWTRFNTEQLQRGAHRYRMTLCSQTPKPLTSALPGKCPMLRFEVNAEDGRSDVTDRLTQLVSPMPSGSRPR